MTRQVFLSIAIGVVACGLASSGAVAADGTATRASNEAARGTGVSGPPPSPTPSGSDLGWQFGLRAGWGLSVHGQGTLDSEVFFNDGPLLSGQSGFTKAVNEVDLGVDVLTPWSLGIVRPFATFGVGDAVGDNENTGGVTGFPTAIFTGGRGTPIGVPNEIPGLTTASLKDRMNFYTRVGGDLAFPMPGEGSTASFHVRPYAGLDLRTYTGTLGIHPSILAPFVGPNADLPPDQDVKSSFTRVSPLAGLEFVVPLCSHDYGGMDVYFGGEYQFDVAGNHSIHALVGGDTNVYGSVSGGSVARGFAGFQYHFHLGGS